MATVPTQSNKLLLVKYEKHTREQNTPENNRNPALFNLQRTFIWNIAEGEMFQEMRTMISGAQACFVFPPFNQMCGESGFDESRFHESGC